MSALSSSVGRILRESILEEIGRHKNNPENGSIEIELSSESLALIIGDLPTYPCPESNNKSTLFGHPVRVIQGARIGYRILAVRTLHTEYV